MSMSMSMMWCPFACFHTILALPETSQMVFWPQKGPIMMFLGIFSNWVVLYELWLRKMIRVFHCNDLLGQLTTGDDRDHPLFSFTRFVFIPWSVLRVFYSSFNGILKVLSGLQMYHRSDFRRESLKWILVPRDLDLWLHMRPGSRTSTRDNIGRKPRSHVKLRVEVSGICLERNHFRQFLNPSPLTKISNNSIIFKR